MPVTHPHACLRAAHVTTYRTGERTSHLSGAAQGAGSEQRPGQHRLQRQLRHVAADVREGAVVVQGPQAVESRRGRGRGCGSRGHGAGVVRIVCRCQV